MKRALSFLLVLSLLAFLSGEAAAGSIFDLMGEGDLGYEADLEQFYLDEMVSAAVDGRVEDGRKAGDNRDAIIEMNGSDSLRISFDELYLLSRLIYAEAGSDWLTDEFRMCIGEVVMNRVASPEFPDTLYDVIYQKGQYAAAASPGFDTLVPPSNCVDIALRLLQGERCMVQSVVFCSGNIQGDIFSVYEDWRLGVIYFCVSNNIELYPVD